MKPKLNPKIIAMMAACTVVANVAAVGSARAQGMPADAQQLVQTMRPMYMAQATPDQTTPDQTQTATAPTPAQQTDDSAYGGTMSGTSASASGRKQNCSDMPHCDIFFGQ